MPAFSEAVLPMWTALLVGWLTNICYITGEIRWAETKTTANLKATCPISISVQEAVVTLTSRKWIVQIPVPQGVRNAIVHVPMGTVGRAGRGSFSTGLVWAERWGIVRVPRSFLDPLCDCRPLRTIHEINCLSE